VFPLNLRLFVSTALLSAVAVGTAQKLLVQENKSIQPPRRLFQVELRKQVSKLLVEVELIYGKPVREERRDIKTQGWALATISDDGAPEITIDPSVTPTETMIVHELFHLKFRAEGFELGFGYVMPPGWDTRENMEALSKLERTVYNNIEHWMFFPDIRKMGIDPATRERAELAEVLEKRVFPGGHPSLENRSVLYFVVALQQGPGSKSLQQLASWYRAEHWDDSLVLGNQLVDAVVEHQPRTAQEAVEAYIRCLNLIHASTFQFDFRRWDHQTRGSLEFATPIIGVSRKQ
jgi:hypothetical protein